MKITKDTHAKPAAVIMLMLDTVHLDAPYSAIPVASLICASCTSHIRAQHAQLFLTPCKLVEGTAPSRFTVSLDAPHSAMSSCNILCTGYMAPVLISRISYQAGVRHPRIAYLECYVFRDCGLSVGL